MKPKAVVFGLALFLLAASFGFFPRAAAQDETGAHGGDLVVALQDFGDVNPTAAAAADRKVLELLYDSLGRIDPVTLQFVPWAASGWAYDGAQNITVTLRDDLRFHDGVAYDADAVVRSLNTYMKSGVQRWNVVKVNELTVRFDFTAINTATWNYKVNNEAGPGLFYTEGLSAFLAWDAAGTRKYSGPFSVASETATQLRIVPNENHFAVRPNLNSITYKWPYTVQLDANGMSTANDAVCALLFGQIHLIGWSLQTNDITNTHDCVAGGFGGFNGASVNAAFGLPASDGAQATDWTFGGWNRFNPANATGHKHTSGGNPGDDFSIHMGSVKNGTVGGFIQQSFEVTVSGPTGTVNLDYRVGAWGNVTTNMTIYAFVEASTGSPNLADLAWSITLSPPGGGAWASASVDVTSKITTPGTYYLKVAGATSNANVSGGTETQLLVDNVDVSWDGRLSLLSTDPDPHVANVGTAKNPGTDFLYFGLSYNVGSVFIGGPGSAGQMLRSAIYQFVNKGLYRNIEPNSNIMHGLQNSFNSPWAPTSCAPWTPCNTIVEAATVVAPAPVNQRTNSDPGVLALTMAGFLDRDGDGIRETAAGQPVSITIVAPSFTLDPRKTTMANDMQALLSIGQLDVTVVVYDTWAALDAAVTACTTSCLYVKRYTAAMQMPDWVYDVAEIRAAGDTATDLHLNLGSRSSWTLADRTLHVGHVSHLVGAAADFLPVLHFDTLEGYDFQSFGGWVNTFGGINNFWSLTQLRLPAMGGLHVRASIFPLGLGPGETGAVQVEVRDDAGVLIPGADVALASGFAGALTSVSGVTSATGTFRTDYTAPTLTETQDDTVWVTVTKVQYTGDQASTSVTVHPPLDGLLSVVVTTSDASIDFDGSATITVTVRDALGVAVVGARVVLSTDLPGGTFLDASGTTVAGVYTTIFTPDVRQGMAYQIFAEVSYGGYDSASDNVRVDVGSNPGSVTPVQTVPGFEAVAAIGAIALTFALVALARRRRED
jgi:hypothetical protein